MKSSSPAPRERSETVVPASAARPSGYRRHLPIVAALLVLAGCASSAPAPVVNRTPQAARPSPNLPPPVVVQPTQPPAPPVALPPPEPPVAEVNPIRGGTLGPGSAGTPAGTEGQAANPGLKTEPRGLKRPFGDMAAVDPKTSGAAAGPVAAAPVAPAPAPAATPPKAGGNGMLDGIAFDWPVKGAVLEDFDKTSGKGVALSARSGEAVAAAADGRVIFSGAGPKGYGNLVIVKHDAELLSVYANNTSLNVKEGQAVKRGQKIAEIGAASGTPPQLIFEIRQQGKPIDPLGVLPRR